MSSSKYQHTFCFGWKQHQRNSSSQNKVNMIRRTNHTLHQSKCMHVHRLTSHCKEGCNCSISIGQLLFLIHSTKSKQPIVCFQWVIIPSHGHQFLWRNCKTFNWPLKAARAQGNFAPFSFVLHISHSETLFCPYLAIKPMTLGFKLWPLPNLKSI
jgi:hypothetical protein